MNTYFHDTKSTLTQTIINRIIFKLSIRFRYLRKQASFQNLTGHKVIQAKQIKTFFLFHFILLLLFCNSASANDARLSFVVEDTANPLRLSLVIDHADKIAGIKVVLTFDKDSLALKQADKSKETSSFLHVVNDKIPGQIIFVMASAKGVSGKNLTLCHFEFIKRDAAHQINNEVTVTQIQIMDEDLHEIAANYPIHTFE